MFRVGKRSHCQRRPASCVFKASRLFGRHLRHSKRTSKRTKSLQMSLKEFKIEKNLSKILSQVKEGQIGWLCVQPPPQLFVQTGHPVKQAFLENSDFKKQRALHKTPQTLLDSLTNRGRTLKPFSKENLRRRICILEERRTVPPAWLRRPSPKNVGHRKEME